MKRTNIGVWSITGGRPARLASATIERESQLEDWIEADVSLVNPDLLIVGRQVRVESGILDLLAVDRLGNYWAVIEIKRGDARRETVAQAVDYAAAIDMMSPAELAECVAKYLERRGGKLKKFLKRNDLDDTIFDSETRDIAIYVVGTGRDPNLDRMATYMAGKGHEIRVVTFDVFKETNRGELCFVRQLEDFEPDKPVVTSPQPDKPAMTKSQPDKPAMTKSQPVESSTREDDIERLMAKAEKNGIRPAVEIIYNKAVEHGLYPRTYSKSLMYAPPVDKRRWLIFTPVVMHGDRYNFSFNVQAFAEFYEISQFRVTWVLGTYNVLEATEANARDFAGRLDRLFEIINQNRNS